MSLRILMEVIRPYMPLKDEFEIKTISKFNGLEYLH